MKTFLLSINLNNDAFSENESTELVACLDRVSQQVNDQHTRHTRNLLCGNSYDTFTARPVRDTHGNTVGSWRIPTETFDGSDD